MVRHDDECYEVVVLQMLRAVVDGIHYQLRDGLLFQVERSTPGGVEISVHPDKGLSRILFVWRRVECVWQAPVEMPPCLPPIRGEVDAAVDPWLISGCGWEESPGKEKKSRDESRLSRLDSLRHHLSEQYCA